MHAQISVRAVLWLIRRGDGTRAIESCTRCRYHIHGIVNAWLCAHVTCAVVEFQRSFTAGSERLRDGQPPVTIFMGVPTMYVMLLRTLQGNMSRDVRAASVEAA